jgi:hypothetical protein
VNGPALLRALALPLLATLAFVSKGKTQSPSSPSPQLGQPFGPATNAIFLQSRARAFRMLVGSHLCPGSRFRDEFGSLTVRLESATNGLEKRFPGTGFGLVQDGHNPIQTPSDCDDEWVAGMLTEYRDIVAEVEAMAASPGEPN